MEIGKKIGAKRTTLDLKEIGREIVPLRITRAEKKTSPSKPARGEKLESLSDAFEQMSEITWERKNLSDLRKARKQGHPTRGGSGSGVSPFSSQSGSGKKETQATDDDGDLRVEAVSLRTKGIGGRDRPVSADLPGARHRGRKQHDMDWWYDDESKRGTGMKKKAQRPHTASASVVGSRGSRKSERMVGAEDHESGTMASLIQRFRDGKELPSEDETSKVMWWKRDGKSEERQQHDFNLVAEDERWKSDDEFAPKKSMESVEFSKYLSSDVSLVNEEEKMETATLGSVGGVVMEDTESPAFGPTASETSDTSDDLDMDQALVDGPSGIEYLVAKYGMDKEEEQEFSGGYDVADDLDGDGKRRQKKGRTDDDSAIGDIEHDGDDGDGGAKRRSPSLIIRELMQSGKDQEKDGRSGLLDPSRVDDSLELRTQEILAKSAKAMRMSLGEEDLLDSEDIEEIVRQARKRISEENASENVLNEDADVDDNGEDDLLSKSLPLSPLKKSIGTEGTKRLLGSKTEEKEGIEDEGYDELRDSLSKSLNDSIVKVADVCHPREEIDIDSLAVSDRVRQILEESNVDPKFAQDVLEMLGARKASSDLVITSDLIEEMTSDGASRQSEYDKGAKNLKGDDDDDTQLEASPTALSEKSHVVRRLGMGDTESVGSLFPSSSRSVIKQEISSADRMNGRRAHDDFGEVRKDIDDEDVVVVESEEEGEEEESEKYDAPLEMSELDTKDDDQAEDVVASSSIENPTSDERDPATERVSMDAFRSKPPGSRNRASHVKTRIMEELRIDVDVHAPLASSPVLSPAQSPTHSPTRRRRRSVEGYLEDPVVASVISTTVSAAFGSQQEWEKCTYEYFHLLQQSAAMKQKRVSIDDRLKRSTDDENLRDGVRYVEVGGEDSLKRSGQDVEEEEMVFDDAFLDECVQPSSESEEEGPGDNEFLMSDPVVQMMSKRVSELEAEYARLDKD